MIQYRAGKYSKYKGRLQVTVWEDAPSKPLDRKGSIRGNGGALNNSSLNTTGLILTSLFLPSFCPSLPPSCLLSFLPPCPAFPPSFTFSFSLFFPLPSPLLPSLSLPLPSPSFLPSFCRDKLKFTHSSFLSYWTSHFHPATIISFHAYRMLDL